MRLLAGNYLAPPNAVAVQRSGSTFRPYGVGLYFEWLWNVTVYLTSQQADTTARQNDFANQERFWMALSGTPDLTWAMLTDDGSPTGMALAPADTIISSTGFTGVKRASWSEPRAGQGEYAGMRVINFTLTAKYPLGPLGGVVSRFSETLTMQGARPVARAWVGIGGSVGITVSRPGRPWRATQSGEAVGLLDYPNYGGPNGCPLPMFTGPNVLQQVSQTAKASAQVRDGGVLMEFPISWTYEFEGVIPLTGTPRQWLG